jgi:hypothetical protein
VPGDTQTSFQCRALITPDDLGTSPRNFVIEAEDYDFNGGQSVPGLDEHALRAHLSRVTSGVGTANQTLEDLGYFDAPGSGGWETVP